jgi:hypothetical protein
MGNIFFDAEDVRDSIQGLLAQFAFVNILGNYHRLLRLESSSVRDKFVTPEYGLDGLGKPC